MSATGLSRGTKQGVRKTPDRVDPGGGHLCRSQPIRQLRSCAAGYGRARLRGRPPGNDPLPEFWGAKRRRHDKRPCRENERQEPAAGHERSRFHVTPYDGSAQRTCEAQISAALEALDTDRRARHHSYWFGDTRE
jgi:hypothetical protein